MTETLGQKQRRFAWDVANLIVEIRARGFECSLGESKRSDEQAEINAIGEGGRLRAASLLKKDFPGLASAIVNNGKNNGVRNSVHQLSIAIDLNLFKDGQYLSMTDDHSQFGIWWEEQSPDHRWGGRWGDGNHYSIEHNGVK